jgi:DNA repair protein RecO (recombination protein O)
MTERATALVILGTDWSETSRIATLFTREFGKVRALAKGGRRLKSSFDIAFDLLTVCEVVLIRKHTGGLDLLTEARLTQQFPGLRKHLPSLYAGYYIAELLADGTADYDPHPDLFDEAVHALDHLGNTPESMHSTVIAFELAWLRELGYSPQFEECVLCGTAVPGNATRAQYSPSAGGIVCRFCGHQAADRFWMSRAALNALRQPGTPGPWPELRQVMGRTICYRLGKRPRLLSRLEAGS